MLELGANSTVSNNVLQQTVHDDSLATSRLAAIKSTVLRNCLRFLCDHDYGLAKEEERDEALHIYPFGQFVEMFLEHGVECVASLRYALLVALREI